MDADTIGFNDRWDAMTKDEQQLGGANLRNVWTTDTKTNFSSSSDGKRSDPAQ